MLNFGERLTEERKRLGLNQTDFGAVGGVTKTSQVNYESGMRSPDAKYWQAIAELGADVNYILTGVRMAKPEIEPKKETVLTGEGAMLKGGGAGGENFSDEDLQILRMIRRLPPTQKNYQVKNIEVFLQSADEMLRDLKKYGGEDLRMAA